MSLATRIYFNQSFEVPVVSTSKELFVKEARSLTNRVAEYVREALLQFEIEKDYYVINNLVYSLGHVFENSIDSYLRKDFEIGQKMILNIVIAERDKKFVLEIQDNGLGFLNRRKGEEFEYDRKLDRTVKTSMTIPYLGGMGSGMGSLISEGTMLGYKVRLRNGEREGATVIIAFNTLPKLHLAPVPSTNLQRRIGLCCGVLAVICSALFLIRMALSLSQART